MPPPVFRFAPSPNGYLHLGHAFSAMLNADLARQSGGRFLLRRTSVAGAREQWLLLHKHDAAAVPGWDPEQLPRWVKSGRTNDEVAAQG